MKGNLIPGLDVWILVCLLQPPRAFHRLGWSSHKSIPGPSRTKHDKGQPACRQLWLDQTWSGFSLAVLVPLFFNKIAANLTQELPKDVKLNGGYWQCSDSDCYYFLTVIQLDSDRQPELWVSHPMLVPELPDLHPILFPAISQLWWMWWLVEQFDNHSNFPAVQY